MKYVDYCILCESKKLLAYPAAMSPFIAERVWGSKPFKVKLLRCKNCGFEFFNLRMDENECLKIYGNYRDEEYQKQREKYEPYYNKEFNRNLGNNVIKINNRRANLSAIIKKFVPDITKIKNILDFGGERGNFITDDFVNAQKYVYEISDANPIKGIVKISDFKELNRRKFDFIMCCHVLEHVSSPLKTLNQIKRVSHGDTIFYVEVPSQSVFEFKINSFKTLAKKMLFFNPSVYNYFSAFCKFIHWKNLEFMMHEHVNFFSEKSLSKLLISSGFEILYIKSDLIDCGYNREGTLSCLAKTGR